jgi:hypothetical protein
VGFYEPGELPQGDPPSFACQWSFVAPADGLFHFSLTSVDAHFYPLTNGAAVCVSAAENSNSSGGGSSSSSGGGNAPCIATATVDQRTGIRDGRWQRAITDVPLRFNASYVFTLSADPRRGGFAAADALLVESTVPYHSGSALKSSVVVGAMDSRILLKA